MKKSLISQAENNQIVPQTACVEQVGTQKQSIVLVEG